MARIVIDTTDIDAVLCDMDGVITSTRAVHERAWGRVLAQPLAQSRLPPLSHADYRTHIDGRRREEGIRAFLSAKGIAASDDDVAHIAAAKNAIYLEELERVGAAPLPGVTDFLARAKAAGLRLGLFTASRNAASVLRAAGVADAFDAIVDGIVAGAEHLPGKPAPQTLLACAQRLGIPPRRCAIFEDAPAGIAAARAGGFGFAFGLGEGSDAERLRANGAHAVAASFGEVDIV